MFAVRSGLTQRRAFGLFFFARIWNHCSFFAGAPPATIGNRADDSPIGLCLGAQGIETVVARVQKAIVDRGYVTTRVLAGRQDLSSGTLTLTLIPGGISAVRFAPESVSTTSLRNAIPAKAGDLLQLRDIEQGLENLKRLPTADADIQVEPSTAAGARPGDSDLVMKYSRKAALTLA